MPHDLPAVSGDLGTPGGQQLQRAHAVPGQVAVGLRGRGVARLAGIDYQHRAPGPGQGERPGQAGQAAPATTTSTATPVRVSSCPLFSLLDPSWTAGCGRASI